MDDSSDLTVEAGVAATEILRVDQMIDGSLVVVYIGGVPGHGLLCRETTGEEGRVAFDFTAGPGGVPRMLLSQD